MNNYSNFRNFNFYNMDPYINENIVSYNKNIDNNLYDSYNGFIRGNLFENLYSPYKEKEPYEVKPINEQARMLTDIDSLCFSLTDLNLYLDIYPDDKNIINLFNKYRKEKEALTMEYESKFGPLTLNSDSLNSYPWDWINMPWPWDK